jgi:hypothetical protein
VLSRLQQFDAELETQLLKRLNEEESADILAEIRSNVEAELEAELELGATPLIAESNILERFGNPRQLAIRLALARLVPSPGHTRLVIASVGAATFLLPLVPFLQAWNISIGFVAAILCLAGGVFVAIASFLARRFMPLHLLGPIAISTIVALGIYSAIWIPIGEDGKGWIMRWEIESFRAEQNQTIAMEVRRIAKVEPIVKAFKNNLLEAANPAYDSTEKAYRTLRPQVPHRQPRFDPLHHFEPDFAIARDRWLMMGGAELRSARESQQEAQLFLDRLNQNLTDPFVSARNLASDFATYGAAVWAVVTPFHWLFCALGAQRFLRRRKSRHPTIS